MAMLQRRQANAEDGEHLFILTPRGLILVVTVAGLSHGWFSKPDFR